jgi:hypothetical protein
MKKILMLAAIFALVTTSCFAADVTTAATGDMAFTATGLELHGDATSADKTTAIIGKCSTGVGVGWVTEDGGYALITQHENGTKAYGSSYDSTSLYSSIATKGAVLEASPDDITTATFVDTGWSAM